MPGQTIYNAEVIWERDQQAFVDLQYSRAHRWRFDNHLELRATASPHVVAPALTDPTALDPEQAFVASISSCHMLWFLSIAAKQKFCVDRYHDTASGILEVNADGKLAITVVTLRPAVVFSGALQPDRVEIEAMHTDAHHHCFIANSVRSEIRCLPVFAQTEPTK